VNLKSWLNLRHRLASRMSIQLSRLPALEDLPVRCRVVFSVPSNLIIDIAPGENRRSSSRSCGGGMPPREPNAAFAGAQTLPNQVTTTTEHEKSDQLVRNINADPSRIPLSPMYP